MANLTVNYRFIKPIPTENYDIGVPNSNMDKIDTILGSIQKFQTAEGTATSITLDNIILENGVSKTFIVASNNNGSSTKINGKNLYKPNTTTAPTLTAGKAVTIWYDATGDCFFIKASATGTATSDKVLAGATYSTEEDTDKIGTMPDNNAVTITPGTTNKAISKGYHNGGGYVAGDAGLISSNIKAGKSIFGITGDKNVVDTYDANVTPYVMPTGFSGYVKGEKIEGQVSSLQIATITPKTTDQVITSPKFIAGAQTIKGDANLIPANIKSGVSIFGVAGSLSSGKKFASGTVTPGGFLYFTKADDSNIQLRSVTVTGLTFTPSIIILYIPIGTPVPVVYISTGVFSANGGYPYTPIVSSEGYGIKLAGQAYVNSTGFQLPAPSSVSTNWVAIE